MAVRDDTEREGLRARYRELERLGWVKSHLVIWFRPSEESIEDSTHPAQLSWEQLRELPPPARLSIAYARLLALRDALSLEPLVNRPSGKQKPRDDDPDYLQTFLSWWDHDLIWPMERDGADGAVPEPDPSKLPPELAAEMLKLVADDLAPPMSLEAALKTLVQRESWRLDELPTGFGPNVCRLLDAEGWIEVCSWVRENLSTHPDKPKWQDQRWSLGWFSPIKRPEAAGGWDQLFSEIMPPWKPPAELRVTEQGRAAVVRLSMVPAPAPTAVTDPTAEFSHGDDFTWIVFAGVKYDLVKGNQSEAIRALWESWERGGRRNGCGLSENTIGAKCGSASDRFRLAQVFRGHPAWGTIIRPSGKGVFALFLPESPQNPTS
jgi:hypothetical protein